MPGSADPLRCAVDDDVCAQRQRLLEQRRRKGSVDCEQRVFGEPGSDCGDVGELQQRVGWRLQPDELGSLGGCDDRSDVRDVDVAQVDASCGGALAELGPETHVQRVGGHDDATDRHQIEHGGGGGDAGREGDRLAALQLADDGLKGLPRLVARSPVADAAARSKGAVQR